MLNWWRQPSQNRNIEGIYGVIVAQAREPIFYAEYSVPDTVAGRFDMIVLHLFLYARRTGGAGNPDLGQALFDRFCADLDGNLREMGVGDMTVPKRMQKYAEAFYGRCAAYEKTLAANDREAFAAALARNVFGSDEPSPDARRIADYVFASAAALADIDDARLVRGDFRFPTPSAPATAEDR